MTIETASLATTPPAAAENPAHAKQAIDDLLTAFEAFKQANDNRLAEIETRQTADVLLEEKVDRINAQLGHLSAAAQRPASPNGAGDEAHEAKADFERYLRGQAGPAEMKAVPDKFSSATHEALVLPDYLEARLNDDMAASSPLVRLATHRVVDNNATLKWVTPADTLTAKWVGETSTRSTIDAVDLVTVDIDVNEVYANPVASQRFIDDSAVDVEAWMVRALSDSFAAAENEAFFNGSGTNRPKGILRATTSPAPTDSTTVKSLLTGVNAAFPTSNASDKLLETMFGVDAIYRQNAAWMFNASVMAEVRKMKDKSGSYVWVPATRHGEAPLLFGHPAYEDSQMSGLTKDGKIAAFGDFSRAYMIVRRSHTQLIRDPYSNKPLVQFYATRRVGGGVIDAKAYTVLQASTK